MIGTIFMKYIYIANWKMNLSFKQSIAFCTDNAKALNDLAHDTAGIILCPSFDALANIANIFNTSSIAIGAQNCSEYNLGAYTGQVSAASLADINIKYCIVGHSEQRIYFHETTEQIIEKIELLFANNITPIICFGETQQDYQNKKTKIVLQDQLNPIIKTVAQHKNKSTIFAYEPVWSIGTGIIPTHTELTSIFTWIADTLHQQLPHHTYHLVYGGSVSVDNITMLKQIPHIDGFLIGNASTQFEDFKKIICQ
jgi:triosephosphate isomerase